MCPWALSDAPDEAEAAAVWGAQGLPCHFIGQLAVPFNCPNTYCLHEHNHSMDCKSFYLLYTISLFYPKTL